MISVNADINLMVANDKGFGDMLKAVGFDLAAEEKKEANHIRIWAHAWK